MEQWLPLHSQYISPESLPLLGILTFAAIGAALLLGLALAAFVRRQSQPYLLIASAFVALFGRSVVGGLTVVGAISPGMHHFLEHGLDVILVALIVAAVYYARSTVPSIDSNP